MIVDAWIRHLTAASLRQSMLAALMRWRAMDPNGFSDPISVDVTLDGDHAAACKE